MKKGDIEKARELSDRLDNILLAQRLLANPYPHGKKKLVKLEVEGTLDRDSGRDNVYLMVGRDDAEDILLHQQQKCEAVLKKLGVEL